MSGEEIANAVKEALGEASAETGNGSPLIGTLVRKGAKTGPDYDPSYGPDERFDFNVVLGTFSERERQGTAILATDTKIICSIGDTVPTINDVMEVDGVKYNVYGVDPTKPGGVDLAYKIWSRS